MTQFTKDDLRALAQLSAINLEEAEVAPLMNQIGTILEYVGQLQKIDTTGLDSVRLTNQNVFREDAVIQQPSDDILSQAPARHEHYFTVPQILEQPK